VGLSGARRPRLRREDCVDVVAQLAQGPLLGTPRWRPDYVHSWLQFATVSFANPSAGRYETREGADHCTALAALDGTLDTAVGAAVDAALHAAVVWAVCNSPVAASCNEQILQARLATIQSTDSQ